ncbi:small integral membrane protein 9 [Acomys russatus]|uniref:small integral membrane protein 9 n=1 Tax=Acomys russatus TaxID=60746 RepID=UPI0021E1BF8A|nr:small integral membrane protein 9 [Acomys russatus]
MKHLKLFCVGLSLCLLFCLFLETTTPPSALLTFEVKEKAGLKSGAVSIFAIRMNALDFKSQKTQVSGPQSSQMTKLKNHLSDVFKSSIPPAAMFAFFVTVALMGILCCLTVCFLMVAAEAAIEILGEPPRQWTIDQRSPPGVQNISLIPTFLLPLSLIDPLSKWQCF